jgi:hypothetical protein
MGDRVGMKGAVASQIPKSMHWSYNVNFKLMVIDVSNKKQLKCGTEIWCFRTDYKVLDEIKGTIKRSNFNLKSMGMSLVLMKRFCKTCAL